MSESRTSLWTMILLVGLTVVVYSFAINGSFKTMDDEYSIVRNEKIQSFKNLPEVMTSSFFAGNSYYRPLVSVSFMVEYALYKLNPVPYYIDNILIHVLNVLLVYGIVLHLIRRQSTALFASFLYALHPIQWEAVSNIPGRAILLCAFFYYASFSLFLQANKSKIYSYLSIAAFGLALLCKESAAVLPLILFCYLYFVKEEKGRRIFNILNQVLPYLGLVILYIFARHAMGITNLFPWRTPGEYVLGFVSFLRSIITDLRLLVFPVDLYFDRSQPFYLDFSNTGFITTALIFLTAVMALFKLRKSISGVTAFFMSWFFVELLPVSQIVSTVGVQPGYISTAEHFLYTPTVGFFALAALAYDYFKTVNDRRHFVSPKVQQVAILGFAVFLVLLTIQYNIYSSNETAMFERTLKINPTNTRIRMSLALSYAKRNRFDLAEMHFNQVLRVEPYNPKARIGLAKALCDQGKYWEGLREYDKVQEPGSLKSLLDENVHSTLLFLVSRYEQIVRVDPQNAKAFHSLGVVYSKLGQPKKAAGYYEKAIVIDPGLRDSIYNLAATEEVLGNREKAITLYQQLLQMRTGNTPDDLEKMAINRLGELARHPTDPRAPVDLK